MADDLLDATGARDNLWSVGLGMPGPVAFDADGATSMPTMPDWDRFPTRARLAARWAAPVWMENRVNLSALGERRVNPVAAASQQTVYLGGGEEIGAAMVVDGRIYRGARGLAGEIAHVPVPEAGRRRLPVRQARLPRRGRRPRRRSSGTAGCWPRSGRARSSPRCSRATGVIRPVDVTEAADSGDPAAQALLHRSAPSARRAAWPRSSTSSTPTWSSSAVAWRGPAPT